MRKIIELASLCVLVLGLAVACSPEDETLNAPTGLKAEIPTATTVALSWVGVAEADKYMVAIGDMEAVEVAAAEYEASGLTANTQYAWKVQAVRGGVSSKWVDGPAFTTTVEGARGMQFVSAGVNSGFGDYYGDGTVNYELCFKNFDSSVGGFNGMELIVDVVAAMADIDMNPSFESLDLPAGIYDMASESTATPYTFVGDFSTVVSYSDGREIGRDNITGGSITIDGNHTEYHIIFEINHTSGTLIAEYNGPLAIANPQYAGPAIDLGTLSYFYQMEYHADAFGNGTADGWLVSVLDSNIRVEDSRFVGNGWVLQSQISAPLNSGTPMPDGTYTIGDNLAPWSALAGYASALGRAGTWVLRMEDATVAEAYPLVSGTITSSYSDGAYTLRVDAVGQGASSVTATLKGSPTGAPVSAK